ncbi:MAG: hypothetical protein J1E61_07070 [Lachnospiraceae bacterium]|nr:hypothetical protein [Lachnospiraceae bacterium]
MDKLQGAWKKIIVVMLCILFMAFPISGCQKEDVPEEENPLEETVLSDNNAIEKADGERSEEPVSLPEQRMVSFVDVYGNRYEAAFNEMAAVHEYQPEYFERNGAFFSYHQPGYISRVGIDVSKFQGNINWEKVADQGIRFAFIRVGNRGYGASGSLNTDPYYLQNIEGAKKAGIDVGVYFYSQAISEEEAIEEAEYVLTLLDGISLEYPVVYDAEYVIEDEARTDGMSAEQATKNTLAFCKRIEEAGYEAVIYATMKWEVYSLEMDRITQYDIWYADYEPLPQTPYDFTYWQYTNEAKIDGVQGPVDLNLEIIPIEEKQDEILSDMTLEEKVAQLFVVTPEALSKDADVLHGTSGLREGLMQYPVGGLIYFSQHIQSPEQVKGLLKASDAYGREASYVPLFLAVDEEGGTVARVANTPDMGVAKVDDMERIGAEGNENKAYETGKQIGSYLSELGFNLDFAPVADTLTNPDNTVVKKRSFGSDPETVSKFSLAYLDGLMETGVIGTLKHFPGHGSTKGDTHDGYAYTDQTYAQLMAADLIPFRNGADKEVPFIMAGHISLPNVTEQDLPASLSYEILTEILREDLDYDGIIITDALNMGAIAERYSSGEACVLALEAGADMLLMPVDFENAYESVLTAVREGRLSEERINESVRRILYVKLSYLRY